jgi:hypothetical protein
MSWARDSRFQEAIAVSVYDRDCGGIGDADVVWLDTDQLAILLVGVVNALISLSPPGLQKQPEVGKLGSEWTWDVSDRGVEGKVGNEEDEDGNGRERIAGDEEVDDRHLWRGLSRGGGWWLGRIGDPQVLEREKRWGRVEVGGRKREIEKRRKRN